MFNKTRVMLYVQDVDLIKEFWTTTLGAQLIESTDLPDSFSSHTLSISPNFELSLFPQEFIKKYSPEVLGNTPSIMLYSDNFESLYESIPGAGEIFDNNGTLTFNFPDPEGNYFVIAKA